MDPLSALTPPFTAPWLLAPMEGVTDRTFRALVLQRNPPRCLGGVTSEFLRVLDRPRRPSEVQRHLWDGECPGEGEHGRPLGLQLMGSDAQALAHTAAAAVELGLRWIDLNFGCPARGAQRGRAGSAVLRDPHVLERLTAATVASVRAIRPRSEELWVSAKIRAGYDDADCIEQLAQAVEQGGADFLTIHCRTHAEHYSPQVDWTRIARAVACVSIPVCGNGGVGTHADLARMRNETGCALVMVGRAALADPWIFSGRSVACGEAARFLLDYARGMQATGASPRATAARLKQLLKVWRAGELLPSEEDRSQRLRERVPEALFAWLEELAEGSITERESRSHR